MGEPVVFVSHFTIDETAVDAFRRYTKETTEELEKAKPRTGVFVAFLSGDLANATFIHVFSDADSMDAHVQGAEERSKAAYEYITPAGWEIYGKPNESTMEMFRQAAAGTGAGLTVESKYLAGFLRLQVLS
jgi:hypothetical protein